MTETAMEAATRAVGPLIEEIRALDDLIAPADLVFGNFVKAAGEWAMFVRLEDDGRMCLRRQGSACEWHYEPTLGERFVWQAGAFP